MEEGITLTEATLPVKGGLEVKVRCERESETFTATCILDNTFSNLPLCAGDIFSLMKSRNSL